MKVFIILVNVLFILQSCNSQTINETSWYYFDSNSLEDSVYCEISFDDSLNICFYTENIQTCMEGKLEKDVLLRSYDFNSGKVDKNFILLKTTDKMIIVDSNEKKLVLHRLPYFSSEYMQTEFYEKEFYKRKSKYEKL